MTDNVETIVEKPKTELAADADDKATEEPAPLTEWLGGNTEYTGWVDLSGGGVFLDGNQAAFRSRYGVNYDGFGGASDLHWEKYIGENGLLAIDGTFMVDVLPSMVLLGIGAGMAFDPVLLAAMNDAAPEESGLASGVVNTSFMMGGAVGLAILASLSDARTRSLADAGVEALAALNGGYQFTFLLGAVLTAAGALVAALWLRPRLQPEAATVPAG